MSHQVDETRLAAIRQREQAATKTDGPDAKMNRYEHGGGRLFIDGDTRNLIADFYEEPDREFYYHARADIPYLLTQLDAQAQTIAMAEHDSKAQAVERIRLEARLTRLTEGLRTLRTFDTPSAQEGKFTIVVAHRDIVALLADPETP